MSAQDVMTEARDATAYLGLRPLTDTYQHERAVLTNGKCCESSASIASVRDCYTQVNRSGSGDSRVFALDPHGSAAWSTGCANSWGEAAPTADSTVLVNAAWSRVLFGCNPNWGLLVVTDIPLASAS